MAITPIGTAATANYGSSTKTASLSASLVRAVSAGHTLVVFVTLEGAGGVTATLTATDARGNTYVAGPKISDGTTRAVYSLVGNVTTALLNGDTITVSSTDGTNPLARNRWNIVVEEVNGLVAAPLDATASATGTSNVLSAGTTGVTAQAEEIVFAAYSHGPLNTFSPGAGYTAGGSSVTSAGTTDMKLSTEYQVLDTAGAQTPAATQSSSSSFAGITLTLKAAATATTAADGASGTNWTLTGTTATAALGDGSDTTYMKSGDNPTGTNPLTITFATPSAAPSSSQTVTFRLRLWATGASSSSVTVTIKDGATTIQTFSGQTITATPTDYAFTLTSANRDAITAADATWANVTAVVAATAAP